MFCDLEPLHECRVNSDHKNGKNSSSYHLTSPLCQGLHIHKSNFDNSPVNHISWMNHLRFREVPSDMSKVTWLVSNKPWIQNWVRVGVGVFAPFITPLPPRSP